MPFRLEDVILLSHAPKLNIEALTEGIFVKVRRTEGGLSQIWTNPHAWSAVKKNMHHTKGW